MIYFLCNSMHLFKILTLSLELRMPLGIIIKNKYKYIYKYKLIVQLEEGTTAIKNEYLLHVACFVPWSPRCMFK